jgi:hypothetical protein
VSRLTRAAIAAGWLAAAAVLVLARVAPVTAQNVSASTLKAAFLYNFAKFAEWPDDVLASAQRLSMCVIGDAGVAHALEQTIQGSQIGDHELVVSVLDANASVSACHLLYVSASQTRRAAPALASVRTEAVLTVGDASTFAADGGIAQLILERQQIRFAINSGAAGRARIRLSSRLLRLAQPIEDAPHVTR